MYTNHIMLFEQENLVKNAEELFLEMNGLNNPCICSNEVKKRIIDVFEDIRDIFEPKALISYYDREQIHFSGSKLKINQVILQCPGFERLDRSKIKGLYVCFMTAGSISSFTQSLADQMIADLAGTAVVNTVVSYVQNEMRKNGNISEVYGPGIYGMDVKMMHDLTQLADASIIGIHILDSGMLSPLKSCGSLYFDVERDYRSIDIACQSCLGTTRNCSLCILERKKDLH